MHKSNHLRCVKDAIKQLYGLKNKKIQPIPHHTDSLLSSRVGRISTLYLSPASLWLPLHCLTSSVGLASRTCLASGLAVFWSVLWRMSGIFHFTTHWWTCYCPWPLQSELYPSAPAFILKPASLSKLVWSSTASATIFTLPPSWGMAFYIPNHLIQTDIVYAKALG